MSVIITGMKKHEDCYKCEFHTNYRTNDYGSFCECMLDDECNRINLLEHKIPNFCPLRSIDGLIKEMKFIAKRQEEIALAINDENKRYAHIQVANAYHHCAQVIKEYCKEDQEE